MSSKIDPACIKTIRVKGSSLTGCSFMGKSSKIITCGTDGLIHTHEIGDTYRLTTYGKHEKAVTCVAYNESGKLICAGDADGRIFRTIDSVQAKPKTITGHSSKINTISMSNFNPSFITSSDDKTAKIFDLTKFVYSSSLVGHTYSVTSSSFCPSDENLAMTTSLDRTVKLWDIRSRKESSTLQQRCPVRYAAYHPDGTLISIGLEDGTLTLVDLREQDKIIQVYKAHEGPITSVHFHPNGGFALTTGTDKMVKIWDLMEGQLFFGLNSHQSSVSYGTWNQDGSRFLTCDQDGYALVWQTNFDRLLKKLKLTQ